MNEQIMLTEQLDQGYSGRIRWVHFISIDWKNKHFSLNKYSISDEEIEYSFNEDNPIILLPTVVLNLR